MMSVKVAFLFLSSRTPQGAGCVFLNKSIDAGERGRQTDSPYGPFAELFSTRRRAMLVLTRKIGEKIIINKDTCLTIVAIRGDRVRLGITAPRETLVDRREIHERRSAQRGFSKPLPSGEAAVNTDGTR
jgi:carbon storage regulator